MPTSRHQDGFWIDFEVQEFADFIAALAGIDMEAIHDTLGQELVQIIEERFDTSTDPWGMPWAPIKAYTYRLDNKTRKRSASDTPLKAGLYTPPMSRSFIYDAFPDYVAVGTADPRAKFHTAYPNNNGEEREVIPLREFMGVETPSDYNRLIGVIDDAVGFVMRAA